MDYIRLIRPDPSKWLNRCGSARKSIHFPHCVQRGADPIRFGLQHEETRSSAEKFREKFNELKKAANQNTDEYELLEHLINEAKEVSAAEVARQNNRVRV